MSMETPTALLAILRNIEAETKKLSDAAKNLDVTRSFTLDGRLVGDIGEVLFAQHFELTLDDTQRSSHDGFTVINGVEYQVQVKCRKASSLVTFSSVPEILVVVAFSDDWTNWDVVYNGAGDPVRVKAQEKGLIVDTDHRIRKNGTRASIDLTVEHFRTAARNIAIDAPIVPQRGTPINIFI